MIVLVILLLMPHHSLYHDFIGKFWNYLIALHVQFFVCVFVITCMYKGSLLVLLSFFKSIL